MIVICKSCNTKYDIKDEVIPEQGAQLKCAKCENMIFVTKNNVDSNENTSMSEPDTSNPFSDFDERPTILAPESFHEDFNLEKAANDAVLDDDSSSKSGVSPNFLSEKHKSGPSFDEVFDDFEEELSNDDKKKSTLDNQNENSRKLSTHSKNTKKDDIDDGLDDLFNDLTSDSEDEEETLQLKVDASESKVDDEPTLDIEEMEKKQAEEKKLKEEKLEKQDIFPRDTTSNIKAPKISNDDGETQEISNLQMEKLKEKLKDGLSDSDFIDARNDSDIKEQKNTESKIFVKLENGPSIEFQVEKDLIQWLKAKSSLKGVLYSLDDIEFSPILNHQLFKDVEEIIKKAKDEKVDVVSASDILEKREQPKKANLMPVVAGLGILVVLLIIYILHLSNVVNISFLDSVTPKPKIIKINHTEIEEITTKVKIKKIKKEEINKPSDNSAGDKKGENNNSAGAETQKNTNEVNENTEKKASETPKEDDKKEEIKKDETAKKETKKEEIYKISPKEKRGYYRKARLAVKAKKTKEAKKMYLTLAYNYPKEAEAYGVLFGILKKDKNTKKYASKFIKAYKALASKKENTFVSKDLIKELLK